MSHYQHIFPTYPSVHRGKPIRAILSTRSSDKVGNAVGIIVVEEEARQRILEAGKQKYPGKAWYYEHRKTGPGLASACGTCQLGLAGKCYVQSNVQNSSQPGAAIFDDEFESGIRRAIFKSGWVRSAIAGDMGSLPAEAFFEVKQFIERARSDAKWLGYTHNHEATHLQGTHVLSVDSWVHATQASGWRTFTAISPYDAEMMGGKIVLEPNEFLCPASKEFFAVTGRKVKCEDCGVCTGTDRIPNKRTPVILRHGMGDNRAFKKLGVVNIFNHRGRLVGRLG